MWISKYIYWIDQATDLYRVRVLKIEDDVAHLVAEADTVQARSKTSRALRRVKTFLRPFRRKYQCSNTKLVDQHYGYLSNNFQLNVIRKATCFYSGTLTWTRTG